MRLRHQFGYLVTIVLTFVAGLYGTANAADEAAVKRGQYVFNSSGCIGCHTDFKNQGKRLAGGRPLETPFGTFYGPNITPHKEHGIGSWSDAEFIRAMRDGVAPSGSHYFPVFPYTSFTKMTDQDMRDLKSYLFSLPPVARPNTPHDIKFPFGWRFLQIGWKLLFFDQGTFKPDAANSKAWNRGAYLVQALAHCRECHTPRNGLGGFESSLEFAGTLDAPEGDLVPNITPHQKTGIGKWTNDGLYNFFVRGEYPWGDDVGGTMAEVVAGMSKMTESDLDAIIVYLRSLKPIENKLVKAK